jgi:hypothetical protein
VSPVKYELGFISQKTVFCIVTAVETLNMISIQVGHNKGILSVLKQTK